MELQIRRALEEIATSFENDNMQFYRHLSQSLSTILTTLNEQQEAMKQAHRLQLAKLADIIAEKQKQIQKLKVLREVKNENTAARNQNSSPYKILLRSGKSNQYILKDNGHRDGENGLEDTFSNINISDKKQYRFSLQIGASSGKRTCRISSSNIKNKILNQKNEKITDLVSPRAFVQETETNCFMTKQNQNMTREHNITQDCRSYRYDKGKEDFLKVMSYEERGNENKSKTSSIQEKTRLCRKPSNKSKRELLKKKELSNCETNRVRCVDVTIPIKTINVTTIKPR